MKKFFAVLMVSVLIFALPGCGVSGLFRSYTATFSVYISRDTSDAPSISSKALAPAQVLEESLVELIKTDTVLEAAIEKADSTLTAEALREMISIKSENNTEIFSVSVTSEDSQTALDLANALAEIMPELSEIVEGVSIKLVDSPSVKQTRLFP